MRRRIMKLACQIFLGKRRAHYHSWLMSLSVQGRSGHSPGDAMWHGKRMLQLRRADALAARAGEAIVIIGSGPSVTGADLTNVPAHSAILLNGAISLIGTAIMEPLAVAIEDERFVWRHFAMIRDRIGAETLCLFSPGVLRALCELDAGWVCSRSVILIDDIRKPYGMPRRSRAALEAFDFVTLGEDAGFSSDPDRGVFQGGSVVISALQFALRSHARTIGFLGIDISNAQAPRFYETTGDVAFSGIAGAEKRILAHIALADAHARMTGVTLINHSPVSALKTIGLDYRPFEKIVA
jgi:hypothetical protein